MWPFHIIGRNVRCVCYFCAIICPLWRALCSIDSQANDDDIVAWKRFTHRLSLVREINRWPVNSPHTGTVICSFGVYLSFIWISSGILLHISKFLRFLCLIHWQLGSAISMLGSTQRAKHGGKDSPPGCLHQSLVCISCCMVETRQLVFVQWQQGKCQLWTVCFMRWCVVSNRDTVRRGDTHTQI